MSEHRRKVCIVLVDRANYGRLKPVMAAVQRHPALTLQTIAAGTMVLERFDAPVQQVRRDGFPVDCQVYMELEGSTPATMAKSVGLGVIEFTNEFQRLEPDFVLVIGDRYEALAATVAAAFMNIPIVHVQGGEVSGSIDESTRHAISKFAHYHFPATERARAYLLRMGERAETILGVGCPSSDIARVLDWTLRSEVLNDRGSGAKLDVARPFLLVVFHSTTTRFGSEREEMEKLLKALASIQMQTLLLWPNIDAGSDHISKAIRVFRDRAGSQWLRILTNLTPENYLKVLANAACVVGNSSSFVRDAGFFGTPVVLVGHRQDHREVGEHVARVAAVEEAIVRAVESQLAHGRYPLCTLYGDGHVSGRIAAALADIEPYTQKHLSFVEEIDY